MKRKEVSGFWLLAFGYWPLAIRPDSQA